MLHDETLISSFEEFVRDAAPRLKDSLGAMFGVDAGREAAADALAHGWEQWDRVREMDNALGYLFVVGRDRARKARTSRRVVLAVVDTQRSPWVEPGLPAALAGLPPRQRTVVMLLHSFDWTMSEVADVMGVSKGTVQSHERRAMKKLRRDLGVAR
jgi:RNA polymerase sigma-70 factor (ECF subfamily)